MFTKNPYKFIWQFLKKNKYLFFLQIFLTIFMDIIHMFVSNQIFKTLLDDIATNKVAYGNAVIRLFVYIVLFLNGFIIGIIIRKIMLKTTFYLQSDMRNSLFQFIRKHQTKFFSDNFAAALNTKINDIVDGTYDIILLL